MAFPDASFSMSQKFIPVAIDPKAFVTASKLAPLSYNAIFAVADPDPSCLTKHPMERKVKAELLITRVPLAAPLFSLSS